MGRGSLLEREGAESPSPEEFSLDLTLEADTAADLVNRTQGIREARAPWRGKALEVDFCPLARLEYVCDWTWGGSIGATLTNDGASMMRLSGGGNVGIFGGRFKGKEKRRSDRIPVPILVETSENGGKSFRARDLSANGFSIEVGQAGSSTGLEAGEQTLEVKIVLDPDEEPIHVIAKSVWKERLPDGTLTRGWVFTDYIGDAKERLSALVHADHDMQRVRARDEVEFDFSPAEIFQAIMDPHTYRQWWPAVIRHKVLDSKGEHPNSPRIEISPFGVSRFRCEIESLTENAEVAYRYYDGACLGTGIWTLTPNAEKTLLAYEIDLAIQSKLIQFASIFIDLHKLHSRNMAWIFRGLRKYLEKQRG